MSAKKEEISSSAPEDVEMKDEISKTEKTKKQQFEEDLSEEDQQLKYSLESLVEQLTSSDVSKYAKSLEELKRHLRESTSSMTAIPKPLVFLQPHYKALTELFEKWTDSKLKSKFADILSILGSSTKKGDSLKYRLLSVESNVTDWGHEYTRHLALEIGEEYAERLESNSNKDDLIKLALELVPFFLDHNGEADAVDLLLEIESIDKLTQFVDKNTYSRVCLYMVSCVSLLAPPDDVSFLKTAYQLYLVNHELPQALALAIRLDDELLIQEIFQATDDVSVWKQLAFILARQNSSFKIDNQEIQDIIGNTKLSEYFSYLTSELNILDPKVPEDYFKSHLESSSKYGSSRSMIDSAKQNLASNFVNAYINLGYCNDKIMSEDTSKSFIYKTKGSGMLSTTASTGAIYQWNESDGLQEADNFLYSSEEEVKAGALLAMGISSNGIHSEVAASFLLLKDYIEPSSRLTQIAAIIGLGIAYTGSKNEEILELLLPIVADNSNSMELSSIAALTLGHVFVGTCNGEIVSTILQALLERESSDLSSKWVKLFCLGLGLLYMGNYESIDVALETISAIEHPISKSLEVLVTGCAYAGTGNVLEIQKLLSLCLTKPEKKENEKEDNDEEEEEEGDDVEEEEEDDDDDEVMENNEDVNSDSVKKDHQSSKDKENKKDEETTIENTDSTFQAYAVLSIAMISMGEEIGQDMSLRHFGHLMHYGNNVIKKAVPLALGMVSPSNPQMKVYETLSRYSHDADIDVAINSIFAMGVVGAGTNNARLSQLFRQLASYYARHQNALFVSRISQGLLHLGKGTLSLNPFNTDRQILSKVHLASLLTTCVLFLDPSDFVLNDSHYLLYYLNAGIHPRMLVTVDEDLNPIKVNVRVGQAVDTVGQAGKPKTITGWVTQETPVLLGHGERAELENDEYISLASALEGIVILKKNPDFMDVDAQ